MASDLHPIPAEDGGPRALLPVAVGIVVIALFSLGLLFGGRAEDDFTHLAGLAISGFSLVVGTRYMNRLLP